MILKKKVHRLSMYFSTNQRGTVAVSITYDQFVYHEAKYELRFEKW